MNSPIGLALAGLLVSGIAAATQADQDANIFELAGAEAKQTAKDFQPAPVRIATNFGTLQFGGGAFPMDASTLRAFVSWLWQVPRRWS
jgi:hypothetical protein